MSPLYGGMRTASRMGFLLDQLLVNYICISNKAIEFRDATLLKMRDPSIHIHLRFCCGSTLYIKCIVICLMGLNNKVGKLVRLRERLKSLAEIVE